MGNHHSGHEAPKKVAFGAPIIMGLSFWLIAFSFLTMCDGPKEECCGGEDECCKMEQHEGVKEGHGEMKEEAAETSEKTMVMDSAAVNTVDPAKVNEPVKEEAEKEEEHKH